MKYPKELRFRGGAKMLANVTGATVNTVYSWGSSGKIPECHKVMVRKLMAELSQPQPVAKPEPQPVPAETQADAPKLSDIVRMFADYLRSQGA